MVVVCDLVCNIRDLSFQGWTSSGQKTFADVTELSSVSLRAVFQNALARLEGEIQAVERGIALLEMIDHSQALKIVLEAAIRLHTFIQSILS